MIKTALITGGGSGIGFAIAEKLSQNGFQITIVGRNEKKLLDAADRLKEKGGKVIAKACDISKAKEVDSLFQSVDPEGLHALVNSAGIAGFAPVEQTSLEDWEASLSINLTGPFLVTRKALPLLEKVGGHIFNVISVAGKKVFPNCGAYCASKFGLYGFTEVLREEMRPKGIKVTAVLPGATDTPIFDNLAGDWDREKMVQPSDVADALWTALNQSPNALLEEIIIAPASGAL